MMWGEEESLQVILLIDGVESYLRVVREYLNTVRAVR